MITILSGSRGKLRGEQNTELDLKGGVTNNTETASKQSCLINQQNITLWPLLCSQT